VRTDSIPVSGRVLALDWGTARIGVAISDETQLVASPLAVLHRRAGKRFPLGPFLTLVEQQTPAGLVVGLPLDDDGREGNHAHLAREMGELCAARAGLPLAFVDESFSTADTLTMLNVSGHGSQASGLKSDLDAFAAAELLQQWLDQRHRERGG
jgi:putative Holliday junction resolvase